MSIASLYPSINPSLLLDFANSKVLDPRITFTRTTTATYYDGVTTAKAEENLLTYSQEFDNAAWSKTNVTVTANSVAAPDGTTTADTVTQSAGTDSKITGQAITGSAGQSYAVSVYAKAGTNNYIQLLFGGSNTDFANFDLSGAGAVGTVSGFTSGTTATITSVGNSWFRCVVSWSSLGTAFTSVSVCLIPSSTSARAATTANTNTVYLWGMQMEQRSSATAYTATTTQAITNYIPVLQTASAGQARFDHNPTTGESLGLLIEEARTNLVTYSEQFDNAAWSKSSATITANTIVAPDGTLTGDKIVEDTSNASHYLFQTSSTAIGTYSLSAYMKAAGRSFGWMYANTGASATAYFDLANGTVGTVSGTYSPTATITSVGNGWYRCTMTFAATNSNFNVGFGATTANGTLSYTGNGFSGIFIWGAQLEAGSFATSYIPTVASSVTRNADAASMTGTNFSSWFGNGEGTVYTEFAKFGVKAYGYLYSISNGATNEEISLNFDSAGTILYARIYSGGGYQMQATLTSSVTDNVFYRNSFGFEVNNSAASWNAGAVVTDSVCTIPNCNALVLAASAAGSDIQSCRIKKFAFYPQRVSNTNLVALTT